MTGSRKFVLLINFPAIINHSRRAGVMLDGYDCAFTVKIQIKYRHAQCFLHFSSCFCPMCWLKNCSADLLASSLAMSHSLLHEAFLHYSHGVVEELCLPSVFSQLQNYNDFSAFPSPRRTDFLFNFYILERWERILLLNRSSNLYPVLKIYLDAEKTY